LSTLTKVLIVLLTISSIFLCGIVVTYVSYAGNYRQMYDKLKADKGAAEQNEINARKQLKLANDTADERELKLNDKINALNIEIDQLETQLTEAKREAVTATEEESKWKTATVEFYNTNERQRKLLEDTLAKLKAIQTDQIQGDQELKETTDTLIRKMAIISDLEKKLKLTLEEKTDMQNQLGQQLQKSGQTIAPPLTVTQVKETARVATPAVDIGLNGLISTVDLENSLAEISIGSANGVKQNMKFHVTRADKFICDIVILDVEPENAIGTLELIDATKEQPKAGDNVSTNL
jgi:DNA repair exonuclease SbcCD ATPase subunit